ncbi:UDP-N-acetylmuramoyl-L-alanine--D-glutamate ligase [Candidatus Saccharibacteria bacterium]|nr:UDP-N-acetylmuramoyl-L-alanine--D-glutamate ligase [Candidatus Saccharibacteria bacterium]
MKIAILGYGKEGKSAENYFKKSGADIQIFDDFKNEDLDKIDFSGFDLVFRSPSVPPRAGVSSMTRYFFDHIKAPVIGVTGTKGKGTTCSMIAGILKAFGKKVFLVGNIGNPSIDILDEAAESDVIVYEMSSFQLWDMEKSPKIAVVLRIEPDHLNVHKDFDDYVNAKGHIAEFQKAGDSVIYFKDNKNSVKIAEKSAGKKIPYPIIKKTKKLTELLNSLKVPGEHNKENAEAALLAVAEFFEVSLDELIEKDFDKLKDSLHNFKGLPHHIEFVKTVNGVDYYDDSFSASYPSLEVAVKSFPNKKVILIAGGKDRGLDLAPMKKAIFDAPNLEKAILIGETRLKLAENEDENKYILADDFYTAVKTAKELAEKTDNAIVLLSPGAASFDMFKDFYDRGDKFKKIVEDF